MQPLWNLGNQIICKTWALKISGSNEASKFKKPFIPPVKTPIW